MLTHFFPNFLTRQRRRWCYAVVEVLSIVVFAVCASVSIGMRGYRLGLADPGMARITAMCVMALSAGTFVVTVCLKQIDYE
jgi:hypothetical protein